MKPDYKWLTNPEVFQVNRLEAHSDHISYKTIDEIKLGKTSFRQSLNGKWRFLFSQSFSEIPEDFYLEDYPLDDFVSINVPGHIELQGHGQIQYINTLYPWDAHSDIRPPEIDLERTTVGNYIRTFDLNPELKGKDIFISFQGVDKAFYVWLNGHFIGYSEDSFTPSEFDLTPYIKEENNRLSVQVFQNSSASWLEDQDMFRFSGIFRDVYLYTKPEIHVDDIWYKTEVKDNSGELTVRLKLNNNEENSEIVLKIDDPDGGEIINQKLDLTDRGEFKFSEKLTIPDVKLWSHEKPNLYSTLLTVKNAKGEIEEVIPYKIGFRELKIDNGIITLNGDRLFIKGVNRHEWHPNKGRAIDQADMLNDLNVIKHNNINAVRTSHYPNQSFWYELCDENGIYLVDETNLETHGSWMKLMAVDPEWNVPGDKKEWKEAVLDRARSMFERDKNHPSILFWSVGNESYAGSNLMAMADFFREQDNSRLVHYEGSFHNRDYNDISDVESQMYSSPTMIAEFLDNDQSKPFILCEFMHNMGNSLGGFDSYIELGDKYDQFQGGFIWDFKDQALWKKDSKGHPYLAYGGDFGERQSDYNFSGNGIVSADLIEKPATQEIKYWYLTPEERLVIDQRNNETRDNYIKELNKEINDLKVSQNSPLKITKGDGGIGIKGGNFELIFSYSEGGLVSLKKVNNEWIWRAPKPTFWRAPTENDIGNKFDRTSGIWQAVDSTLKAETHKILTESDDEFAIEFIYTTPVMPDLALSLLYKVYPSGLIKLDLKTKIPDDAPEIASFGLRFETAEEIESFSWIGIENETYPDRKQGIFGKFTDSPKESPYLVPQEMGNHTDTLFTNLITGGKSELQIYFDHNPYNFSVLPFTPGQLQEAYHMNELPNSLRSVITINGFMRGVGGIDSWGSDIEEKYRLKEKDYEFSFYLI